MSSNRERTGNSFNSIAEEYDSVRPSYPSALIDDAISLAGLPVDGRILEIGCGTGKASELFAAKGYALECLDVGAGLAAVATEKLNGYKNVQVKVTSFEDWDSNRNLYDLVLAAASFHWIDPRIRFTKSASILKQTGALTLFSNSHVRKDEGFFSKVQDIYRTHAPSMAQIAQERKKLWAEPVIGEDLFNEPLCRKYSWVAEYRAEEYITLLRTYSDRISLPEEERSKLFEEITKLIQDDYAGVVQKHYEAVLTLRTVKPNKAA